MTGYQIKKMVFMLIGLAIGFWAGGPCFSSFMRYGAQAIVKERHGKQAVEAHPELYAQEVTAIVQNAENESANPDFTTMMIILAIYAVPCGIGLFGGVLVAGDPPPQPA
jgi:hypothetical protein